jgi:ribosomal protein S18 acetylase RimI-like enzyme
MNVEFGFRPVEPDDSPALAGLVSSTPSSGSTGFTYDYLASALDVHKAFASNLHGIVATANSSVIGMVLGDFCQIQWEGRVCEAAYVSNLRVHPDFRRQGVARGILSYGNRYAEKLLGADPVVYAAVPQGNVGLTLAQAHDCQTTGPIQGGIVPMLRSAPKSTTALEVRAVDQDDLAEVAHGMNQFYRKHNLWSPVTPSTLDDFQNTSVAGIRPNRLYVVARNHRIVGGLSLSNRTQLIRMKITNIPGYAKLLGALLRLLPRDGVLRALTVRHVWFADGELEAVRYLWNYLRHSLRDQGDALGVAYDPRDRLADVFQIPFWLPMFKACYIVRASTALDPDRPVYCLAGP